MLSKFHATLLEIMYKAKDHIKNSLKKRQNLQQYMKTHTFYLYFELLHVSITLITPGTCGPYKPYPMRKYSTGMHRMWLLRSVTTDPQACTCEDIKLGM